MEDPEPQTPRGIDEGPPSPGRYIREQRLRHGMTLEEVSAKTKIPRSSLEALEEERWSALPGPVFVKGFLRCCARALEIDDQVVLDLLYEQERAKMHAERGPEREPERGPERGSERGPGRRPERRPKRGLGLGRGLARRFGRRERDRGAVREDEQEPEFADDERAEDEGAERGYGRGFGSREELEEEDDGRGRGFGRGEDDRRYGRGFDAGERQDTQGAQDAQGYEREDDRGYGRSFVVDDDREDDREDERGYGRAFDAPEERDGRGHGRGYGDRDEPGVHADESGYGRAFDALSRDRAGHADDRGFEPRVARRGADRGDDDDERWGEPERDPRDRRPRGSIRAGPRIPSRRSRSRRGTVSGREPRAPSEFIRDLLERFGNVAARLPGANILLWVGVALLVLGLAFAVLMAFGAQQAVPPQS